MNKRIKELARQVEACYIPRYDMWQMDSETMKKFAELIVKECADFVRETYDHEAAESIAWTMEIEYGLHGDYA
jgi:hypothetical protein